MSAHLTWDGCETWTICGCVFGTPTPATRTVSPAVHHHGLMSNSANPCQNTYPLKSIGTNNTSQWLVLSVQMKRKKYHSFPQRGSYCHKGILYFSLCCGTKKSTTRSQWGEGMGKREGGMQKGLGHRSKDLSFTASSEMEHFHSQS